MADRNCRICGDSLPKRSGPGRPPVLCPKCRAGARPEPGVPFREKWQTGNASKRLKDRTPGEWVYWRGLSRHGRAIRVIESFCRPPKGYGAGDMLRLAPFQKERLEEW